MIDRYSAVLGYTLAKHSQAADEWETTAGGRYFCAGVGAGIAGHRADLGLIDDPLGSEEDANSEVVREKQFQWYYNDFWPRLLPHAGQIIIANRRHMQDLVGMILEKEASKWTVIRLPMIAEENDALGRSPGDRLWPEWYTEEQVEVARSSTRTWAGLWQQRPSPEEGDFFKREWLVGYEPQDLPDERRVYGAGDFAVSTDKRANKTCIGFGAVGQDGLLYILPEIIWTREAGDKLIEKWITLACKNQTLTFWAEKGHISKSLKPFMRLRMHERNEYVNIEEVTPVKAKDVRARSIQARMSQGMVRFPKFAPWWPDAEFELLSAFNADQDDFVDMLAHLGQGIDKMVKPHVKAQENEIHIEDGEVEPWRPTLKWMRQQTDRQEREHERAIEDM